MAITIEIRQPATVGDTEPCPTCAHVKAPEKRLHTLACCGLESHQVWWGVVPMALDYVLAHRWRDDDTYAAVASWTPISEQDALAWLERAHAGEVDRRALVKGETITFDRWED